MLKKTTIIASLRRLAIWLLLLATWEAAYRVIGWKDWVFPAPSHIVDATLNMLNVRTGFGEPIEKGWPFFESSPDKAIFSSQLITANLISAQRLVIGFVLSIILGAVLGILMWQWDWLDDFLGPLFLGFQTLPSVCWVPIGVLAFGLDEKALQFVLIAGSFFAIAISLRDGLRTIPPLYHRAGLMLGARGWKLYRYVLLPASLPALAGSLRSGFGFAWRSLMGAEFVLALSKHGLGFLLDAGRNLNDSHQVMAVMIIMVMIGSLMDRLVFAPLERRVGARFGLILAK